MRLSARDLLMLQTINDFNIKRRFDTYDRVQRHQELAIENLDGEAYIKVYEWV